MTEHAKSSRQRSTPVCWGVRQYQGLWECTFPVIRAATFCSQPHFCDAVCMPGQATVECLDLGLPAGITNDSAAEWEPPEGSA
jgi:hypothetical protein